MHHYHYYYYKISIALLHFHLRLCSDLHVNCDVAINRRYFTCLDRCVVFVVVCVSKSPFSFLCTIYCTIILLYAPSFIRVLSNVRVPIPDGIVRTASVRFQGWHRAWHCKVPLAPRQGSMDFLQAVSQSRSGCGQVSVRKCDVAKCDTAWRSIGAPRGMPWRGTAVCVASWRHASFSVTCSFDACYSCSYSCSCSCSTHTADAFVQQGTTTFKLALPKE